MRGWAVVAVAVAAVGCGGKTGTGMNVGNDFWRVADVTFTSSGRCVITGLARGGRPYVTPDRDAQSRP